MKLLLLLRCKRKLDRGKCSKLRIRELNEVIIDAPGTFN